MGTISERFVAHQVAMRRSAETIRQYRRVAMAADGALDLATVTSAQLQTYVNELCGSSSANTMRSYVVVLKALFAWMVPAGERSDNPAQELQAARCESDLTPPPSADRIMRVLASMRAADLALGALLYGCGLRISEGYAVTRSLLDLPGRTLTVRGKGNKLRTIAMPSATAQLVARYVATMPPDRDELFPVRGFGDRLRDAAVALGEDPEPWHPHMLRHACATHLTQASVQDAKVQRQLRHSSPATTRRYQRLAVDDLVQALDAHPLNRLLAGPVVARVELPGVPTSAARVQLRGWAA